MKANVKATVRLFKKHFIRLLTIVFIVIVSVGFMSGVGEVDGTLKQVVNEHYATHNLSDLYVKSKRTTGFTLEERSKLRQRFGSENIEESLCFEFKEEDEIVRVYTYDLAGSAINRLELVEGVFPTETNQIVAEKKTDSFASYEIGEKVNVYGVEYTVCGIVKNPMMILEENEPSFNYTGEFLSNVLYLNAEALLLVNDVHIVLDDRTLFNAYSNDYKEHINALKAELESELGTENVSVLSLYENAGVYSLVSYAEKVGKIGIIFVVFFLLVTLLVVFSTLSRLFDEERSQIACQKTLGYSDFRAVGRYILFVAVGVLLGGGAALPVGYGLLRVLYYAFNTLYLMPPFPMGLRFSYYLVTVAIIFAFNAALGLIAGLKTAKGTPAALLVPKAPKSGKKVILERIPLLWNRLSFKYKSTLRNVLLFKSRFLMTVVSVVGSTVLVFAGMGLVDCAVLRENASAIVAVALVVLVFSAALCALVVYNLTNINISERRREIATLMVLGYQDKEVSGYIYREIYIMSLVGALIGLPVGILFMDFVFAAINFGQLSEVKWWTYLLTPLLTMFFSFLATKLLRKKIVSTDMNASLKSLE